MNCRTTQEHTSLWLDEELPPEELTPLFAHLAGCELCRDFLTRAKAVHHAAQRMNVIAAPELLDKKFGVLAMGIERQHPSGKTVTISVPSVLYSVGAAVMMLLFIYVFGSYQERNIASQYQQPVNWPQQNGAQTFEHQ